MNDPANLHEYDKVEWFDVMRKIKPTLTWEEYSADWDEFQALKAERERLRGMQ